MKNIDTFRMRVRPGRKYMHSDYEFIVKDLTMIKADRNIAETWKPAIVYERVNAPDGQQVTFTRTLEDFLSNFVPEQLEIGDFIEAVSMNKSRGFLVVSDIKDEIAYFEGTDLKTFIDIDVKSLRINAINPTQATDYYLLIPQETAADYYRMTEEIIHKIAQYRCAVDVSSADSIENCQKARAMIKKISEVINAK